jgi:hypothetical protein
MIKACEFFKILREHVDFLLLNQQLQNSKVSVQHSNMGHCVADFVSNVNVSASLNEELHRRVLSHQNGVHHRCVAVIVGLINHLEQLKWTLRKFIYDDRKTAIFMVVLRRNVDERITVCFLLEVQQVLQALCFSKFLNEISAILLVDIVFKHEALIVIYLNRQADSYWDYWAYL